jgi:hypothetical protein
MLHWVQLVYCHVYMCDCRRGFGLNIGFTDHLYTQLGTTSNYTSIANLSILQISTNSFPACCVFNSRFLVTASNGGDLSASVLKSSLNGGSLPIEYFHHRFPYGTDQAYNTAHSPMLTVSSEMCLPNCSLSAAVYSCLLRICCLATDVVPLSPEPFAPGGYISGSTVPALSKYATRYILWRVRLVTRRIIYGVSI